jgi:hypothetical protein
VLAIVFVKKYTVQAAKVLQKGSVEWEGVTRAASVESERPAWFSRSVQFSPLDEWLMDK